MAHMRALYRTVAAIAVALPLVVAGSSIANAGTDNGDGKPSKPCHKSCHKPHHKMHHKMHLKAVKLNVDQDFKQLAHQRNSIGRTGPVSIVGNNNSLNTQSNSAPQTGQQSAFTR